MLVGVKAVIFDADGVLIDSLPQHLQICHDKAREFGLALNIPTVAQFRDLVRRDVKISPMRDFFAAVGFPPEKLDQAVRDYERDFARLYRPARFPAVSELLADAAQRLKLGIVSSNTESNIAPVLGASMQHFQESCLYFFDQWPKQSNKAQCLKQSALVLGLQPSDCAYVGDQPSDLAAAREAGFRFVGVAYGWGIAREDSGALGVPVASSVDELRGWLAA